MSNSGLKTVLEEVLCCLWGVAEAKGGLRPEVLAMLLKMVVKERERGEGGLMKYLRFKPKKGP